jgi:hypothetical protein
MADPLIASLRAAGSLQPLRFCLNSSLVPPELLGGSDVDWYGGPLWLVDSGARLVSALAAACQGPPPHLDRSTWVGGGG